LSRLFLYIYFMSIDLKRTRYLPKNLRKMNTTFNYDKTSFWGETFSKLFDRYGDPFWWPGSDAWEVAVGAILTQNTSWTNVEKALKNLRESGIVSANKLLDIDSTKLARLIRPSGYFNQKAKKLVSLAEWWLKNVDFENSVSFSDEELREELLNIWGIGPETADSISLYAFGKANFVVDAYTMRIRSRVSGSEKKPAYADVQAEVHAQLPHNPLLFNYLHGLIVVLAKEHCLARNPKCLDCALSDSCKYFHVGIQ
jgi:endonuclease III related protein